MASDPPLHFTDDLVISSHVAHNAGVVFFRSLSPSLGPQSWALPSGPLAHHSCSFPGQDRSDACSRAWASLVAGSVLGIVGWSGWSGFLWYFVAHAVVSGVSVCEPSFLRKPHQGLPSVLVV